MESSDEDDRTLIAAMEVGAWAGLGPNSVRLELAPRRTVLVGRNGAGKSLLIAGIFRGAREAWWQDERHDAPGYFRCEVRRPNQPELVYQYRRIYADMEEDLSDGAMESAPSGPTRARVAHWEEGCWEDGVAEIWKVANGILTQRGESPTALSPGVGFLNIIEARSGPTPPEEARLLSMLMGRVAMVPAGVPRSGPTDRREVLARANRRGSRRLWRRTVPRDRIEALAVSLASMHENQSPLYEEFVTLAGNLGIAREVLVKIYRDPSPTSPEVHTDFASVMFDGVNIGFLSDGTLRVAEMLIDLIRPNASVVLLEEPETAVHPALLGQVLNLVDTYSSDRQVVISTHSPMVVDWCRPGELRLVERVATQTMSRNLTDQEVKRVTSYLCDEGTVSDFLFSRADE
jgi:hypothetical protein